MSLIVSAYDGDDDGVENRIAYWLRLDGWSLENACWLFLDVCPDSVKYSKSKIFSLKTLRGKLISFFDDFESDGAISELLAKYDAGHNDLCRIFSNWAYEYSDNQNYIEPKAYVDKAIEKSINIAWLKFANRKGFFLQTPVSSNSDSQIKLNANLGYTTNLLQIQNLAITNFFNPRKNVDARQEEVTKWIIDKGRELGIAVSNNVADSMFTIIKPIDHNPKQRRVKG